ncbi:MAG: NAD(+)--rifampin ADP-ribosyltransferase [Nocardioidaceae bacterium]
MAEDGHTFVPVTFETCGSITGPFLHGTRSALAVGDELVPGRGSNYQTGRVSNHLYFTTREETAAWGAELASALAGDEGRGRVWVGHTPEVLQGMLDSLARLREQGLDVIED